MGRALWQEDNEVDCKTERRTEEDEAVRVSGAGRAQNTTSPGGHVRNWFAVGSIEERWANRERGGIACDDGNR